MANGFATALSPLRGLAAAHLAPSGFNHFRRRYLMDIQTLLDAVSDAARSTRSDYHVTLGKLRDLCRDNPGGRVIIDGEKGLGDEHSYRGYYADLAFEPVAEPSPSVDVLAACERALSGTYEGYKGGDFRYDEHAPLWVASYGCCGAAIVSASVRNGDVHLVTRDED
jgi:hypothetical protein